MGIFDSAILSEIPFSSTPKRNVIIGTGSSVSGGGSDILISESTGTLSSTGSVLNMGKWVDFWGDNDRPVFVGLLVDRDVNNSADGWIGGVSSTEGEASYRVKITKSTSGGSGQPLTSMTGSYWSPGENLGDGAFTYLPPSSIWTIDYEKDTDYGRRKYGMRIYAATDGITLSMKNVRIMCFAL